MIFKTYTLHPTPYALHSTLQSGLISRVMPAKMNTKKTSCCLDVEVSLTVGVCVRARAYMLVCVCESVCVCAYVGPKIRTTCVCTRIQHTIAYLHVLEKGPKYTVVPLRPARFARRTSGKLPHPGCRSNKVGGGISGMPWRYCGS